MDNFADFHAHHWARLEPDLIELDSERRRVLAKIAALVLGAAVAALAVSGLLVAMEAGPGFFIVPLVIFGITSMAGSSMLTSRYRSGFKQRVIGPLVHALDESLRYDAHALIGQQEFRASRLFSTKPDRFRGEDLVHGRVGATALRFCELHAEYQSTSTDSDGKTETTWHTIFKGIFFIADFNKHFAGVTVVLPDRAERLFGRFGQKLQSMARAFSDLELVTLEDPDFEKAFVVYSNNQVEARYILSTSLMRRLLNYRRKTGHNLLISFVNSQINIAIPTTRDLFEPPLLSSCANPELIRTYLEDLLMMIGIVEDLNLNLRIWSKQ